MATLYRRSLESRGGRQRLFRQLRRDDPVGRIRLRLQGPAAAGLLLTRSTRCSPSCTRCSSGRPSSSAVSVGFRSVHGLFTTSRSTGGPALALDLAEEFRPIVADSATLTLFNNSELRSADFIPRSGAVSLTQEGRKTVLRAFERRMDTLIRHPLFGYSVSYRRIMEVQARLLGRHILGELKRYPAFTTR